MKLVKIKKFITLFVLSLTLFYGFTQVQMASASTTVVTVRIKQIGLVDNGDFLVPADLFYQHNSAMIGNPIGAYQEGTWYPYGSNFGAGTGPGLRHNPSDRTVTNLYYGSSSTFRLHMYDDDMHGVFPNSNDLLLTIKVTISGSVSDGGWSGWTDRRSNTITPISGVSLYTEYTRQVTGYDQVCFGTCGPLYEYTQWNAFYLSITVATTSANIF